VRTRMKLLPGIGSLAVILGVIIVALLGLLLATGPETSSLPWTYVGSVLRFTLLQAALSTLLSLTLGAALALALVRRTDFPGRTLFIAALNLASVLPAIVAVFGLVTVLGRAGWVGGTLRLAGVDFGGRLYGLPGILIAHVFFNAPFAARIFLGALAALPGEHWRLAAQLGMPPAAIFRIFDWPLLRREAPMLAALIFLLCFTSFAIVLTLGGGPGAATLEVAIYEAVRFDVDFTRAGLLALLQVAICIVLALPVLWLTSRPAESATVGTTAARPDARSPAIRWLDALVLGIGALLIVPPLVATAVSGVAALGSLFRLDVVVATATSLCIAVPAALIALVLALGLAAAVRALRSVGRLRSAAAMSLPSGLILAVPPVAISAGLFVVLRKIADPFALAVPLIALVNALMVLPFVLRQVEPPLVISAERYGRLAASLGLEGMTRLRLVDWPLLRRPLAAALAIATALSLGDLGVAAFFGSGNILTLPLLLYQRMGSYRSAESASVALLLAALVLALFLIAQRWGEPLARSR
jgi:thiamine transport system permease protein